MSNKEEQSELLQKMLAKELTILKRTCFKYKHDKPFIRREIIIKADDISIKVDEGQECLGLYNKIGDDYKFHHEIIVNQRYVNDYLNYRRSGWLPKTYYKNRIIKTIRHELVHAFVEENFEIWSDIKGTSNDSSPIFLSVLFWLKGYSGHECVKAFKKSELYNKLSTFKSYDELELHLIMMLHRYEKIAREHEKGIMYTKKLMVKNDYVFSPRGAGLIR